MCMSIYYQLGDTCILIIYGQWGDLWSMYVPVGMCQSMYVSVGICQSMYVPVGMCQSMYVSAARQRTRARSPVLAGIEPGSNPMLYTPAMPRRHRFA